MLDRLTIERMRAWTGDKPVLLALSGGGDSVALLHLLVAELGADRFRAAVVDHALREGSALDAQSAAAFAAALGVDAKILTLTWPEGANTGQHAAREARYRALCGYARGAGLTTMVAAHTADDQAETVLMRAGRGSAWRGLAGISPFTFAPLWPEGRGIALARPLLGARRSALRQYLRDANADWVEDPANANPAYQRVRARARLAEREAADFDPMRFATLARRLRARMDELDAAALKLIERSADLGFEVRIAKAAWKGPEEVRKRALVVLMTAAGGLPGEPSMAEAGYVEPNVFSAGFRGTSFSGVEFSPKADAIVVSRDPGFVLGRSDSVPPLPPLALAANVEAIWDRRLAITAPEPGWRVVPAQNAQLVAFENGVAHKRYADVCEHLKLRPLTAERIRHAFAPDINHAKP